MLANFKQSSPLSFKDFKYELKLVLFLFCFSTAAGLFQANNPPQFIQDILNQVLELANQIGIGNAVDLFTFILINNLIAVFSVIIGGLLLGISPILSSMVNGYVIGIVVGGLIIDGRWEIIAPGILPHGILELPALFLAIALGLKVGRSVYHVIKTTTRNKSSKGWYQKYRQAILQVEPVLYGALKFAWNAIVPLIAIAALIEATATPALIDYVQNYLQ